MENPMERGQVLVLVALSLLVLFAFVALAVDGGGLYRERRLMQNAADAGALAGAQEICFGEPSHARDRALEYAVTRNGAAGAEVTVSDLFSVTVVATETYRTFFAGLMGFREIPIQADATAVCGMAAAGGGLWPIAFDSTRWPEDAELHCGEKLLLWEDGRADCETYDCCKVFDKHGNLIDDICEAGQTKPDIYPLDGRAWVDFSAGISGNDPCDSGGCGANELSDRVDGHTNQGEVCENFVILGSCYARPQGVTTSVLHAVENGAGRVVNIPLYDPCESGKIGDPVIGNSDIYPTEFCPDTAEACTIGHNPGNDCTTDRYRIERLACLQIGIPEGNGWTAYVYLMEPYDPAAPKAKLASIKVLVATIPCEDGEPHSECAATSGWSTGTPPELGDVRAVSLVD